MLSFTMGVRFRLWNCSSARSVAEMGPLRALNHPGFSSLLPYKDEKF
jgi:hypothetical protein